MKYEYVKKGSRPYHIPLEKGECAPLVLTVGDPHRVPEVSKYLDQVYLKKSNREFMAHTGRMGNKDITIISTGMGMDNIEIFFIEMDQIATEPLNFIRLGTTGSIREDLKIRDILISESALCCYGPHIFYTNPKANDLEKKLEEKLPGSPRIFKANKELLNKYAYLGALGNTFTANGFYAPQGRAVDCAPNAHNFLEQLLNIDHPISNIEMETAGIYYFSKLLGHKALSINCVVAERFTGKFSNNTEEDISNFIEVFISTLF